MNDLETIFDNIDEYSDNIDDLVKALRRAGIDSYEEFCSAASEAGVPVKKSYRDLIRDRFTNSENDDWEKTLRSNTIEAYQHYLDSHPDGEHRDLAREKIEDLKKDTVECSTSGDEWGRVDKKSIDELQRFVDKNSRGSEHYEEAANLLKELRRVQYTAVSIDTLAQRLNEIRTDKYVNDPELAIYEEIAGCLDSGKITVEELLKAISEDNNLISASVAYRLWDNNYITDFTKAGIDGDFVRYMMGNNTPQGFDRPAPLTKITKKSCTEVYFWGIPSSGKSCALGAILSCANSGRVVRSMLQETNCQGYDYMNRLADIFKTNDRIGTLPPGTPINSTYEMGFVLEDEKGREHPITCIDLAGELIRCMYKHNGGLDLTIQEQETLETLTNILVDNRTNNRKIHFFVIEYGAEDRLYEGLPQKTYLSAAADYIRNTGIFEKDTVGIYLLITKADKVKAVGRELKEKLQEYISENYQGFLNVLKKICEDNEINGGKSSNGKVEIQPFTLGRVCFQNYCKFKEDTAAAVVRILLNRTDGGRKGKLGKIIRFFQK